MHRERDANFFKKGSKIAGQTRTYTPYFLYTENEYYGSRAMNFIKTDKVNLKYLVALLNSKLISFWLKYKGKRLGEMLHIDKEPLLELPLKTVPENEPFIEIVSHILFLYEKYGDILPNDEISLEIAKYECQIDSMVYKLYDLKPEEIKIIEGDLKQ